MKKEVYDAILGMALVTGVFLTGFMVGQDYQEGKVNPVEVRTVETEKEKAEPTVFFIEVACPARRDPSLDWTEGYARGRCDWTEDADFCRGLR